MSCDGCRGKVEKTLNAIQGVKATVTLDPPRAMVTMQRHVSLPVLQQALSAAGDYRITEPGAGNDDQHPQHHSHEQRHGHTDHPRETAQPKGAYYCPMHCEGDKTYDRPGNCPVCGMNLEKIPQPAATAQYTCPMHPEIVKDRPGSCPICGMDLVPVDPGDGQASKTYEDLLRKMKIATACTVPVFVIAMSEMWHGNPLTELLSPIAWNWVQFFLSLPVLFYSGWMFFQRAYRSIVTWKLNMFTLIGIGTGMAFAFSVVGMLAPGIFPSDFRSAHGTIHLYFEAATVIITLVLLGQLMEARAHSRTSGAIKELMKLAPVDAVLVADGQETRIPISEIQKGNILRVKPGDRIPVDGVVTEGSASVMRR